jgi:hypothetical protein
MPEHFIETEAVPGVPIDDVRRLPNTSRQCNMAFVTSGNAAFIQSVEESKRSQITQLEKIMFPSSRKARN